MKKMNKGIAWLLILCTVCGILAGCKKTDEELGVTDGMGGSVNVNDSDLPSFDDEPEQPSNGEQSGQTEQPSDGEQTPQTPQTPETPETPDTSEKEDQTQTGGEEENPYAVYQNDKSGTTIKIMSQNLRIDSDLEKGTDNDIRVRRYRFKWLVDKYDPDVVGMQEVDDTWMAALPEDFGSTYTIYYFGRNEGGKGEGTPVMWKTAKYKKLKTGAFWLSESPNVCSLSYDTNSPRIVNWVQLEDKETKARFTIYSTHYGFYGSKEIYSKIRQQMIQAFNDRPGYSFWMGDFNIGYKNNAYTRMVDNEKIIDLWDLSEAMQADGHCTVGEFKNGSYNAFNTPEGKGVYGDFIWARVQNNMTIDRFQYCYEMPAVEDRGIGAGYVSDHFAVFAEVRINTDVSYADYYKLLANQE